MKGCLPSLICIAVVGGDDLPGEDGLQEVEVVGEPREEGAVEVAVEEGRRGLTIRLGERAPKVGRCKTRGDKAVNTTTYRRVLWWRRALLGERFVAFS